MTASFSLRFRLKVYSFKMCLRVSPFGTPYCSDQLLFGCASISSGIAICVGVGTRGFTD